MQQVTIAVPKVLIAQIEAMAKDERRNRNNMIQVLLEDAIKMTETAKAIDARPVAKESKGSKSNGAVRLPGRTAPQTATGGTAFVTRG